MTQWQQELEHKWAMLCFGEVKVASDAASHAFEVAVNLGSLDPGSVRVELYADGVNGGKPERWEMAPRGSQPLADANGFIYSARVPATRPAIDYTARMVPHCDGIAIPLEANQILWQR